MRTRFQAFMPHPPSGYRKAVLAICVVLAVQKRLPEWMILARIDASECDFDLSFEALAALHEADVPKAVIAAMIGCGQ